MSKVHGAIYGVTVGDMLGVPIEFSTHEERIADPVTGPRTGGQHDQPLGVWSDDTSNEQLFTIIYVVIYNLLLNTINQAERQTIEALKEKGKWKIVM